MEYVQVPLHIAIKASRVYRPLLSIVKMHIAEMKPKTEAPVVQSDLMKKSKNELVNMAKEAGITNPDKLNKEELIAQLTIEEEEII